MVLRDNPSEYLKHQIQENPAEFSLDERGFKQHVMNIKSKEESFFDQKLQEDMAKRYESFYNYLCHDNLYHIFKAEVHSNNGELESLKAKLRKQSVELLDQTVDNAVRKYAIEFSAIHAKYKILDLEKKLGEHVLRHKTLTNPEILDKDEAAIEKTVGEIKSTGDTIKELETLISDTTNSDPLYSSAKGHLYLALEKKEGLFHEAYGVLKKQSLREQAQNIIEKNFIYMLDKSDIDGYNTGIAHFRYYAIQSLKETYGDGFANLASERFKFKIEQSELDIDTFVVTDLSDSEATIQREVKRNIKSGYSNVKEGLDVIPEFTKEKRELESIIEARIEEEEGLVIDEAEVDENFLDRIFESIPKG